MTTSDWLTVFGALGIASLVPVVWAIVDVARRPAWQFSTGRKVMWGMTLGIGWLILWPIALVSSVVYLAVLRRRFPQVTPGRHGQPMSQGPWPHGGIGSHGTPYGGAHQYGPQPYGAHQYGAQPYGARPSPYPPQVPQLPPAPLPPAAWYPDPAGSGQERWWDGRGWSNHLR